MVRHMVALCTDLGAKVVAECIETVEELKAVADQGVHFAQGYVLARPAYPMPQFDFPLARRAPPSSTVKNRPPPSPIGKLMPRAAAGAAPTPGSKAVPSIPRPQPPAPAPAPAPTPSKPPGKGQSKRPPRRPTPPALPALPKRPPPLPGTR